MWKWLELTWEAAKIGDNKVWMKKGTQLQTKRIKKGKKTKGMDSYNSIQRVFLFNSG